MKRALVFFITLLYGSLCHAQNLPGKAHVSWSKETRGKMKMTLSQVIGENDAGIYVTKTTIKDEVRGKNSLPILEHYNKDLGLIKSKRIQVQNKEGKIIYEDIIQMDGNLYLFYSLVNKWKRTKTLMSRPLDKIGLQVTGNAKKIIEIKIPLINKRERLSDFKFKLSEDNSSLLLFHNSSSENNRPETVQLFVFNKAMELEWSKKVALPFKDKQFETAHFYLDNEKNVYLLGKINPTTNEDSKSGKPNYNYELWSYVNKGMDFQRFDVPSKGKFFRNMQMAVNQQSEIILSGFYSDEDTGSLAGSYFLKLEPKTNRMVKENYHEFPKDFFTPNRRDKKAGKTNRKINNEKQIDRYSCKLEKLIIRENGSITLVGELMEEGNSRRTSQFTQPGGNTSYSGFYSYQDILVVHFSPEGDYEWSEKITKRQNISSGFGFFSSYAMAHVENNTYFIFNDNYENHFNGPGTLANSNPRSRNNLLVFLVSLDSKGNKSKEVLSMPGNPRILIKPSACKQISPNHMIVFGQYRKNFRLAKLKFEDTFSY